MGLKYFIILFSLLCAFLNVHSGRPSSINKAPGQETVHLGTFKEPVRGGALSDFDESNYYASSNSATWSNAENDCATIFGENAGLVSIESEAERAALNRMLNDYGYGITYWTSGMWDGGSQIWRWAATDVELGSWAPWASGYPSTPNPILRVALVFRNQYNATWITVQNTQLHRYICEIRIQQATTAPVISTTTPTAITTTSPVVTPSTPPITPSTTPTTTPPTTRPTTTPPTTLSTTSPTTAATTIPPRTTPTTTTLPSTPASLVIQRRGSDNDNDVREDFYRSWAEYESGFGDTEKDFWIGLSTIHSLTSVANYKLRFDLESWSGEFRFAEYSMFSISGASDNYRLNISGYSGNAGDAMMKDGVDYHNGQQFSAYDRDNDDYSGICTAICHGAWWFNGCSINHLNGEYGNGTYTFRIRWDTWNYSESLKSTEMTIILNQ